MECDSESLAWLFTQYMHSCTALLLSFPLSHPHWTLPLPWCPPSSLLFASLFSGRVSMIGLCYNYLTLSALLPWSTSLHPTRMPAGLSPCSHSAHNCRADRLWHIDLRAGKQKEKKRFLSFPPPSTAHGPICQLFMEDNYRKLKQTWGYRFISTPETCLRLFLHLKIPSLFLFPSFLFSVSWLCLAELIPSSNGALLICILIKVFGLSNRGCRKVGSLIC